MVNKYNNAYHKTIKMKPVDVKSNTYIVSSKRINEKRIFLIKITLEIDLKKFLQLKDFKILFHGHMLLMILAKKKLLEHFTKKNCKK